MTCNSLDWEVNDRWVLLQNKRRLVESLQTNCQPTVPYYITNATVSSQGTSNVLPVTLVQGHVSMRFDVSTSLGCRVNYTHRNRNDRWMRCYAVYSPDTTALDNISTVKIVAYNVCKSKKVKSFPEP